MGVFKVRYVSVRCDGDFEDPKPYATMTDARQAVKDLSQVYWQATITDSAGHPLARAVRSGYNATGKRWLFTEVSQN